VNVFVVRGAIGITTGDAEDRVQANVGTIVAQLDAVDGVCSAVPWTLAIEPGTTGVDVGLVLDAACRLVVSEITESSDAESPGIDAGVPATPDEQVGDVNDVVGLVNDPTDHSVHSCDHTGAVKMSTSNSAVGFITAAELRIEGTWKSTGVGDDGCYGRSVSNIVVNPSNKATYCYANFSQNAMVVYSCDTKVVKHAPTATSGTITGHFGEDLGSCCATSWYLHGLVGASVSQRYTGYCYSDDGSGHAARFSSGTKVHCKVYPLQTVQTS
jgi:hypothetical protein